MGCHKIEDVREVLVGLGLQILRLVSSTTSSNHRGFLTLLNTTDFLCVVGYAWEWVQHICFLPEVFIYQGNYYVYCILLIQIWESKTFLQKGDPLRSDFSH